VNFVGGGMGGGVGLRISGGRLGWGWMLRGRLEVGRKMEKCKKVWDGYRQQSCW
jgi:hypothetical protein